MTATVTRLRAAESVDVHALMLADARAKGREHWALLHTAGDKQPPLPWFERVKRTWRG